LLLYSHDGSLRRQAFCSSAGQGRARIGPHTHLQEHNNTCSGNRPYHAPAAVYSVQSASESGSPAAGSARWQPPHAPWRSIRPAQQGEGSLVAGPPEGWLAGCQAGAGGARLTAAACKSSLAEKLHAGLQRHTSSARRAPSRRSPSRASAASAAATRAASRSPPTAATSSCSRSNAALQGGQRGRRCGCTAAARLAPLGSTPVTCLQGAQALRHARHELLHISRHPTGGGFSTASRPRLRFRFCCLCPRPRRLCLRCRQLFRQLLAFLQQQPTAPCWPWCPEIGRQVTAISPRQHACLL
jgi:hypothetical protein